MGVPTMSRVAIFVLIAAFAAVALAEDPPADEGMPDDMEMTGDPDKDGAAEMANMDGDKDGKVTAKELEDFMRKSYYSSEEDLKDLQNDEGKPATPEDITKMIENDAKELLTELDTDKSGDLNLEEVVAQYRDM